MTIRVRINGQAHSFPQSCDLVSLLERIDVGAGRYAVEINGEVVPRSRYPQVRLNEGDVVEVVQAIGGG